VYRVCTKQGRREAVPSLLRTLVLCSVLIEEEVSLAADRCAHIANGVYRGVLGSFPSFLLLRVRVWVVSIAYRQHRLRDSNSLVPPPPSRLDVWKGGLRVAGKGRARHNLADSDAVVDAPLHGRKLVLLQDILLVTERKVSRISSACEG
jgi:hypothetical protein